MTSQGWEQRTQWPLAAAAVLFLGCYSWVVLEPALDPALRRALGVISFVTWALFVIDYVVRVALAPQKLDHVVRNLPDLLIVALPVLRPLRLLRLVALLRIIDRRASAGLQGRVVLYVVCATVLVTYSGALAELDAERGAPGSNIETFGDALWWATTTITTVGYGDLYPVTTQGRVVAAALMVAGVAFLGAVTAALASWLVGRVRPPVSTHAAAEISALRAELDRVNDLLMQVEAPVEREVDPGSLGSPLHREGGRSPGR